MRTIKIEVSPEPRSGMQMTIGTEVIINDDDNAFEAGKQAQVVVLSFIAGFSDDD